MSDTTTDIRTVVVADRGPVADRRSPQQALAEALGGLLGRDAILVGTHVIWCSVAGVVRVDSTPIGRWSDGVEALAAAYRTAVR